MPTQIHLGTASPEAKRRRHTEVQTQMDLVILEGRHTVMLLLQTIVFLRQDNWARRPSVVKG